MMVLNKSVVGSVVMSLMIRLFCVFGLLFAKTLGAHKYAYALTANYVTVIDTDTDTSVKQIYLPTSSNIYGIVIRPDGRFVYVNDANGNLYVINTDLDRGTIVKTVTGLTPGGNFSAITADGAKLYVVCTDAVDVIDVATQSLSTSIPIPGVQGLVITPDGRRVYVSVPGSHMVRFFSTATDELDPTVISAGSALGGSAMMAVTADGSTLYVNDGTTLRAIDTETSRVTHVYALGTTQGRGIVVTPDGAKVYVGVTSPANFVVCVDTVQNSVIPIETPTHSYFLTLTHDGSQVLTGSSAMIHTNFNISPAPTVDLLQPTLFPAVVKQDNSKAYFPSLSSDEVLVVDLHQRTLKGAIKIAETGATKLVMTPYSLTTEIWGLIIKNHWATLYELTNSVGWHPVVSPTSGQPPQYYRVVRTLSQGEPYTYHTIYTWIEDHNQLPGTTVGYSVFAHIGPLDEPNIGDIIMQIPD